MMMINQATKSNSHEVPLDDILILLVFLDVFDHQRTDLPLGALRGEVATEKINLQSDSFGHFPQNFVL